MVNTSCVICNTGTAKYKCPTCQIRYCSMDCWNSHKVQPCEKPENIVAAPDSSSNYYTFNTKDTVPLEKLKLLECTAGGHLADLDNIEYETHREHHEGVRATLHNPHVRSILNGIDKSRDPSLALKVAMLEPIFVEFVEECLKVVEPSESN